MTNGPSIDPTVQSVADSNNDFALKLYAQLRTAPGNLFFSPYSIDAALLMVHAGAAGATADEMAKTLNLPDKDSADLNRAMGDLAGRFSVGVEKNGYELHVANAMWGQNGQTLLPDYLDELRKNFAAELNLVDFHQSGAAATTINSWVAQKTNDRIKDLISPGALSDQTKLILTNAIYFKGDWQEPFKKRATHLAAWNAASAKGTSTQSDIAVPMMSESGAFDYLKADTFAALQLPYKGGDLAMLVLLPEDPATGLADLEKSLDVKHLSDIAGKLHHEQVQVSLPKFKLSAKYDLTSTLAQMGMHTVFSSTANLSGIDGKRDLFITGVVHQAFVQVDETGTEAAGATGIVVGALRVARRITFIADHPFLFAIRDLNTGTILFLGRVVNPSD